MPQLTKRSLDQDAADYTAREDHVSHLYGGWVAAPIWDAKNSFYVAELFVPSFTCQTLERVGRLGDGGKWMCGVDALVLPAADGGHRPCAIYSFGVNDDVSFEKALMEQLGANPRCRVHLFDPSVARLPEPVRSSTFESVGLSEVSRDRFKTLDELLRAHGDTHADVLKMDIEHAEWLVLDALCAAASPPRLPFDQLLIELHFRAVEPTAARALHECLRAAGFAAFSYEPNPFGCNAVEVAYVRVRSPFVNATARVTDAGGGGGVATRAGLRARLARRADASREADARKREVAAHARKVHRTKGGWSSGGLVWTPYRGRAVPFGPVHIFDLWPARAWCPLRRRLPK